MVRLSCFVKIGINICTSCNGKASYITKDKYINIKLLSCGHGICAVCYDLLKHNFICPMCGTKGKQIKKEFSSDTTIRTINTFSEYLEEFGHYRAMKCENNIFVQLHKQIINDYQKERKKERKKRNEKRLRIKRNKIRKEKEKSRKNAICPHCSKNIFNSEKQLQHHIRKQHRSQTLYTFTDLKRRPICIF